jgi:hypothetical protein
MARVNYAHALLFQGRCAEAQAIYVELAQRKSHARQITYGEIILEDLDLLSRAGIVPESVCAQELVERLRTLLQLPPTWLPVFSTASANHGGEQLERMEGRMEREF